MSNLSFVRDKQDKFLAKIFGSVDGRAALWVVDEFLFDRMTYTEAITQLSELELELDNLELIEFLDTYKEYKKLTP